MPALKKCLPPPRFHPPPPPVSQKKLDPGSNAPGRHPHTVHLRGNAKWDPNNLKECLLPFMDSVAMEKVSEPVNLDDNALCVRAVVCLRLLMRQVRLCMCVCVECIGVGRGGGGRPAPPTPTRPGEGAEPQRHGPLSRAVMRREGSRK